VKSWVVPAIVVVILEYAFALTIGAHVGFRYTIPFAAYVILGLAFAGRSCGKSGGQTGGHNKAAAERHGPPSPLVLR